MANEVPSEEEIRLRERLKTLQERIGIDFGNDTSLLRRAIEHSSSANEEKVRYSNESLEFLGDAILYLTITRILFKLQEQEGLLTEKRKCLIKNRTLLQVGKEMELEKYISVGKSVKGGKGVTDNMISDTVEAIIAAIFLKDSQKFSLENNLGFARVEKFINEWFFDTGIAMRAFSEVDYISVLKEWCDEQGIKWPKPDPEKRGDGFELELEIGGHRVIGEGKSKQAAREDWARQILSSLRPDANQENANGQ